MAGQLVRTVSAFRFAIAFIVALAIPLAFWSTSAFAQGKVTVTPDQVMPGQSFTVNGTGWAPFDQILVSFTDPSGNIIPLGLIAADANGNFQQVIPVPANVPPGSYMIDGNGQGGAVSVRVNIVAPTATPAPPTPTVPPTATAGPPSDTATPSEPSATPEELVPSTPTASPTETESPTPTASPTQTATSTETATSTATPTMTPTATATPSSTPTSTSTSTPTNTPTLPQRVVQAGNGVGLLWLLTVIPAVALGMYLGRRNRQA